MLEDATGIRRVVLACGTVDLRKGIDVKDYYGWAPAFCFFSEKYADRYL